jgi:hypothetical protein
MIRKAPLWIAIWERHGSSHQLFWTAGMIIAWRDWEIHRNHLEISVSNLRFETGTSKYEITVLAITPWHYVEVKRKINSDYDSQHLPEGNDRLQIWSRYSVKKHILLLMMELIIIIIALNLPDVHHPWWWWKHPKPLLSNVPLILSTDLMCQLDLEVEPWRGNNCSCVPCQMTCRGPHISV